MKTLMIRYTGVLALQKVVTKDVEDVALLEERVAARHEVIVQVTDIDGSTVYILPSSVASLRVSDGEPSSSRLDKTERVRDAVRDRLEEIGEDPNYSAGLQLRVPEEMGLLHRSTIQHLMHSGRIPADAADRRRVEAALGVDEGWLDRL